MPAAGPNASLQYWLTPRRLLLVSVAAAVVTIVLKTLAALGLTV